jgi:siroheme synthase (precorrin-2 oxidase/ferrochelatase)
MASINDVDVTEYIERLRQLSGLEIDTAKSGTQNLSEIIDIALSYIEKDKKKVLVNIDTLTQRYIYISTIIEKIEEKLDSTGLENKHEIFYNNVTNITITQKFRSEFMSIISARINNTVYYDIKRLSLYRKELKDMLKRREYLTNVLNYYNTAESDLNQIKQMCA